MIEANALSVLVPAWTTRNIRARAASSSARLAQLYPGVDVFHAVENYLAQHRALTSGLAVLGLLLVGWLFSDRWRADWNGDKAGAVAFGYFIVAVALPTIHLVRCMARFKREHKPAEMKRTAILQRRRLLDFVSPLILAVAALSYLLFVALVFYIEQLKSWAPVAGSVFFTTLTFLSYLGFAAPPRKPEVDELRSSPIC